MTTKMISMFVFSEFCVYTSHTSQAGGAYLMAVRVLSSKDSSAMVPTTAFCSNQPMTLFTALGSSKDS